LDKHGYPTKYELWDLEVGPGPASILTFPTGTGGILYPPHILHEDVDDAATFAELCPTADDVWLYWMAARNGATFRKIGPKRPFPLWIGSQEIALFNTNIRGEAANDVQISNMVDAYGWPPGTIG
jgi:hypothetical protein